MEPLHYLTAANYDILLWMVVKYATLSISAAIMLHDLELLTPVLDCLSKMIRAIYVLIGVIILKFYGLDIMMKYSLIVHVFLIYLNMVFNGLERWGESPVVLAWMWRFMWCGFFVMEAAWMTVKFIFDMLNIEQLDFGVTFWVSLGILAVEVYSSMTTRNIGSLGNVIVFSYGVALNNLARIFKYRGDNSLAEVLSNTQSMAVNITLI